MENTEIINYTMSEAERFRGSILDGIISTFNNSYQTPLYSGVIGNTEDDEKIYTKYIDRQGYACIFQYKENDKLFAYVTPLCKTLQEFLPLAIATLQGRNINEDKVMTFDEIMKDSDVHSYCKQFVLDDYKLEIILPDDKRKQFDPYTVITKSDWKHNTDLNNKGLTFWNKNIWKVRL